MYELEHISLRIIHKPRLQVFEMFFNVIYSDLEIFKNAAEPDHAAELVCEQAYRRQISEGNAGEGVDRRIKALTQPTMLSPVLILYKKWKRVMKGVCRTKHKGWFKKVLTNNHFLLPKYTTPHYIQVMSSRRGAPQVSNYKGPL